MQRRRASLVGDERDPRASYPLGILRARHQILEADHRAGLEFASLRIRALGGLGRPLDRLPSHLAAMVGGQGERGAAVTDDDPETWRRKYEGRYAEAREILKRRGTRVLHITENVVLYERPLRFMDTSRSRSPSAWDADQRDLEALQDGLAALAVHFDFEREPD